MPQLHFYVPEEVAEGWPDDYFEEVLGSWVGEFPATDDPPPVDEPFI